MKSGIVKVWTAAFAFSMVGLSAPQAATINIVRDAGTLYNTNFGIRDNTATVGSDLDGAIITVEYAGGPSEQIVWDGPGTFFPEAGTGVFNEAGVEGYYNIPGWADGTDADLYLEWDGFEVTTTRLVTSISIDLTAASSVFDTIFTLGPSALSTTGSSFGFPFEIYSGGSALMGAITATYTGIVGLAGAAPAGDLFTTLTVDFSGLTAGGFLGELSFRSDMDTLRFAGDLELAVVPLPGSMAVLLGGLAVLMLFGTRFSGRSRFQAA